MEHALTQTHWDNYYNQGKDFGLITASMLDKVLSYIDTNDKKQVLDIGCGTGQLTRELYHRSYSCTGIDASSVAIEKAKRYAVATHKLNYLVFNIEDDAISTLPHQPYSIIFCKLVYAFIHDKEKFLEKVQSLLSAHGTFVLITPLRGDVPEKPNIEVDYNQTMLELQKRFTKIEIFTGLKVTYFICKRH